MSPLLVQSGLMALVLAGVQALTLSPMSVLPSHRAPNHLLMWRHVVLLPLPPSACHRLVSLLFTAYPKVLVGWLPRNCAPYSKTWSLPTLSPRGRNCCRSPPSVGLLHLRSTDSLTLMRALPSLSILARAIASPLGLRPV